MIALEQIGFYTLSDQRARTATHKTALSRCEIVLTSKCNFRCPYCRSVGGDMMDFDLVAKVIRLWGEDGLFAIRFSGGEPLLHPWLLEFVLLAKKVGIRRIAVSSNGSLPLTMYKDLITAGVNDLSISLDACCAEDGDHMAGGIKGAWDKVVRNIRALSQMTYLTVGVVVTEDNASTLNDIICFAAELGVSDIRVISAAQAGSRLESVVVQPSVLDRYPILKYRVNNLRNGRGVRGLEETDTNLCPLVLDDMAVCGDKHYPCIIYLREGGPPIGTVGPQMREERHGWFMAHDTHADRICKSNCLDVCADYNNRWIQSRLGDPGEIS